VYVLAMRAAMHLFKFTAGLIGLFEQLSQLYYSLALWMPPFPRWTLHLFDRGNSFTPAG